MTITITIIIKIETFIVVEKKIIIGGGIRIIKVEKIEIGSQIIRRISNYILIKS